MKDKNIINTLNIDTNKDNIIFIDEYKLNKACKNNKKIRELTKKLMEKTTNINQE